MGQSTARDENGRKYYTNESLLWCSNCTFHDYALSYVWSCAVLDHNNKSPISCLLVWCIKIYTMIWTPHAPTGYRLSRPYHWWPTPDALQVGALRGSVVQDLNTLPGHSGSREGFVEGRLRGPVESKVQDLPSAVIISHINARVLLPPLLQTIYANSLLCIKIVLFWISLKFLSKGNNATLSEPIVVLFTEWHVWTRNKVSKLIRNKLDIARYRDKMTSTFKKWKNLSHFCELPPFTCSHTDMDTMTAAVLSHFDPDLLKCTYS